MLGRGEAVSVEEALALICRNLPPLRTAEESLALEDSYGRVLSHDIASPEDLPSFVRSTMDGYAVRAQDTFGAGEGSPAYLDVTGEIPMGEAPAFSLKTGEAAKVSTGGMLPEGADAVLMFEYAQPLDGGMIEAQKSVAPGENVIQQGEDVREGELLLRRGHRLRPHDVSILAGIGLTRAFVYERPRVSVISTGDEIVPPDTRVKPGLVRDTNSYNLAGLVLEEGCLPLMKGILRDDYAIIREAVAGSLAEADAVLISGGSSVGARDMTERVIQDMGRVLFHSVLLKPGKPLLTGIVEGVPVFGLPGHPRAVSVCFDIFVRPVLRRLAGVPPGGFEDMKKTLRAVLTRGIHSAAGRQESINVYLEETDGELRAVPLLGKSGLITTMVKAHGTVMVPPERLGLERGETVEVKLL